jgi:hypothetical protein
VNNLYDDHYLLAARGIFWRCDHGRTGFKEGFAWVGCARCWLRHRVHQAGRWARRVIVRAAPTCTLWRYRANMDDLVFRPWPCWSIACIEYNQLAWSEGANCMWGRKREMRA